MQQTTDKKMAHDVRHFILCVKLFTDAEYFVVQTLVRASSIVFSSLNVGTHCIYVITQLLNFSAQRLYIGRQLIDLALLEQPASNVEPRT
ncbi:hypothetical protein SEEH2823_03843, partial [Salmonella enterica subsp. enterica serovar Heidelberg str. 77-2823]